MSSATSDSSARYSSAVDAKGGPSTADGSTSSQAASALTHDALQAFDASLPGRGGLPPTLPPTLGGAALAKANMKRSASFGRQDKLRGNAKDSARVAELAQLLADAKADARQAESRLATLQCRLRAEVCVTLPRATPAVTLTSHRCMLTSGVQPCIPPPVTRPLHSA